MATAGCFGWDGGWGIVGRLRLRSRSDDRQRNLQGQSVDTTRSGLWTHLPSERIRTGDDGRWDRRRGGAGRPGGRGRGGAQASGEATDPDGRAGVALDDVMGDGGCGLGEGRAAPRWLGLLLTLPHRDDGGGPDF